MTPGKRLRVAYVVHDLFGYSGASQQAHKLAKFLGDRCDITFINMGGSRSDIPVNFNFNKMF